MIHTDRKLIYADLTYRLRGAIFNVYNELGYGHKESVYQKALIKELEVRGIPYGHELGLDVIYQGEMVGSYRPDLVIDGEIIIEIKAVEIMPKAFENQLINYLKTTGFSLGLLINFGAPKLYIKRLVWTNHPRKSAINLRKSLR